VRVTAWASIWLALDLEGWHPSIDQITARSFGCEVKLLGDSSVYRTPRQVG